MKIDFQRAVLVLVFALVSSGCVIVPQGEVGLKRVWGRIEPQPLQPGYHAIETVSTDVIFVPIRTTTKTHDFVLPSKEGLNVNARISLLYRVDPTQAVQVISTIGVDYHTDLIGPVFRSQAADVSARFYAKDMYSAQRRTIETEIAKAMREILQPRGFVVEAVLMKSIALPPGLARSIEQKLQAEQEADAMRFRIAREKLAADRKRIQAEGDRDAQKIRAEGLTEAVLRLRAIEAFQAISESNNAKVIITDGRTPLAVPPASVDE